MSFDIAFWIKSSTQLVLSRYVLPPFPQREDIHFSFVFDGKIQKSNGITPDPSYRYKSEGQR